MRRGAIFNHQTMIEISIEHGIEMPKNRNRVWGEMGRIRAALGLMAVGDSFLLPSTTSTPKLTYLAAKQVRCVVMMRRIPGQGYRVWLVKKLDQKGNL